MCVCVGGGVLPVQTNNACYSVNLFVSVQAEPIRVVVTGAAGQIAYSLLYSIAKGDVFGKDQVRLSLNSDYVTCSSSLAPFPLKLIAAQTAG